MMIQDLAAGMQWLQQFDSAASGLNIDDCVSLFDYDCYWRDLLAFTWNIRTFEGRLPIREMLVNSFARVRPGRFQLDEKLIGLDGVDGYRFTFETVDGRGEGFFQLRNGKCWTLLTTLTELTDFPEPAGERRELGVVHGAPPAARNWLERKSDYESEMGLREQQPYCVILGGGQAGIVLAARLRRHNVPTIVLERNPRAGDSWRNRYKTLHLHDAVWYDDLPFIPFPDHWPVFTPKDKLGDWLEFYAKIMEINYWGSTECLSANYDAECEAWAINVNRLGKTVILRPKHFVVATGLSGLPYRPEFEGFQSFRGEQMHSSQFVDSIKYGGKNCVVIGSNNSAHDIAADLYYNGANVTMVQRSSTLVLRSKTMIERLQGVLYSEGARHKGITPDKADLISASVPFRLLPELHKEIYREIAAEDKMYYDELRSAGFKLDFGEDGSGLHMKYIRRGSGYYIDVGAASLVASKKIQLKSGVDVSKLTPETVELSDGVSLKADIIVYATGYGSMDTMLSKIVPASMVDKVGPVWGIGSNTYKDPGPWVGELRNMWAPTRQEGLWFHGGNLSQTRYYSQFLALQLKARYEKMRVTVL